MADLLIRNATLPDGRTGVDVLVAHGRIVNVARNINAAAGLTIDAEAQLLAPPFVDAHFHMDSALTYGTPRVNQSGTLLEGIALWGELKPLGELAANEGRVVDMHCDETDDPQSRHVETLAFHAQRLGMQRRVTGSHLTSMHSMDNDYVAKLIPLLAEAGVNAIANPLINITLQGRRDTYPKRRGMTRVPELMAAGIDVTFGHDCVMDP